MKRNKIVVAALLCSMIVTTGANADDITDFDTLQQAIQDASDTKTELTITEATPEIDFTDSNIIIGDSGVNQDITIRGAVASSILKGSSKSISVSDQGDAFNIKTGSTLTLGDIIIQDFGDTSSSATIANAGTLNIEGGTTFTNNKVSGAKGGRPYPKEGGIIYNSGTVNITTSDGKNVTFNQVGDGTTPNLDIYMASGELNIKGESGIVTIGNGIGGEANAGTINHTGKNSLILGGINKMFTGKFNNSAGSVTVNKGASFFGGQSEFTAGSLKWETSEDLDSQASLVFKGGDLTVGNNTDTATLTIQGGSSINDADNIVINSNGTLNIKKTTSFDGSLSGTGNLAVDNAQLTLSGDKISAGSLSFASSNNSTVTLSSMTDGGSVLDAIAKGTNSGLTMNLDGFAGGLTDTLTLDNTNITALNLSNTNSITSGTIDVKSGGTLTNSGTTDIAGNLTVAEGGNVQNNSSLTLSGSANSNKGTFTNSGTLSGNFVNETDGQLNSTRGALNLSSLTNEGGTVNAGTTFTVTGAVENSISGSINGQDMTFGTLSNEDVGSTITADALTLNGPSESVSNPALTNSGTVTASSLTVSKNGITNSGSITVSGTSSVTGKLTNTKDFSSQGGTFDEVENSGSLTLTGGKTQFKNKVSGTSGTITNNGSEVTISSAENDYSGDYVQESGKTTFTGKLFGGKKQIKKGDLTVTAEDTNYNGAIELGEGATLNYTATGTEKSTVSNDKLTFSGTGASANFSGTGGYSLADDIANAEGNNLKFSNTTVTFEGTNYEGNLAFDNSELDLRDNEIKSYTFESFDAKNSTVDFDLKINTEKSTFGEDGTLTGGYLESDTLTFNSGSGELSIGNLYIDTDDQNGQTDYKTQKDVLNGDVTFAGSTVDEENITWSSDSFVYDVNVSDDKKSVSLSNGRAASAQALNDMNVKEGARQFMAEGEYTIDESLDPTESGKFNVFGENKDKTKDSLNGQGKNSFFNVGKDKTTELNIKDLTITGASSTNGGSVLRNESSSSKVTVSNSDITGNTATGGQGGAVYNSGGSKDSSTGLYIEDTTFENNTSDGKGGAVYNDKGGFLSLNNVTTVAGETITEGQNDIYNAGTAETSGTNDFGSLFTNDGTITFAGQNTLADFVNSNSATFNGTKDTIEKFTNSGVDVNINSTEAVITEYTGNGGTVNFNSGNATLGSASGTGSITNGKNLTLTGDNSGFTGTFSQSGGQTTLSSGASFFGGESTVSDGILNWYSKEDLGAGTLTVTGDKTQLYIGDGTEGNAGELTLGAGSSVAEAVQVNVAEYSAVDVAGGSLTLDSEDSWLGTVNVSEKGTLALDSVTNYKGAVLNATGGTVDLQSGALIVQEGSTIADEVETQIGAETNLSIEGGNVTLGDDDTWNGTVTLTSGTLDYNRSSNGTLVADGGNLNLKGGTLTLDTGSSVGDDTLLNIEEDANIDIKNGTLHIDDEDVWTGTVTLDEGGTLNYEAKESGTLVANDGNLNLLAGSTLDLGEKSTVAGEVEVAINSGATVDMKGGEFALDKDDRWNGTVLNEDGTFTADGLDNSASGGQLKQTGGKSTFKGGSNIVISGTDSYINGGDVSVLDGSSLTFATGNNLNIHELEISDSSLFSVMNSQVQDVHAEEHLVEGQSDFALDMDLRQGKSDRFIFDSLKTDGETGDVHIADYRFVGGAPLLRDLEMQLFDAAEIGDNITFSVDEKPIMTPIGEYSVKSLGGGRFLAQLGRYNPKVFRGQVSTLAMYNNQLAINDMLLNHIILHSEKNQFGGGRTANKYSAVNPLFAPYQYTKKDGGLWYKTYVDIERLSMTQNLNVNNTAYGSLIGADLPLVNLKDGWEFIPTFYIGYNGSHQSYSGMNMYQNGGQGGFMGTFMKDDFIGSVLAYGGGYVNEMNVEGNTDNTGNWFAGTAAKVAYNFHPTEHFIIQPTAMVSYNAIGKQNWNTDFGAMSLNSGMLNGINVAPGLNLIYARNTWSLYTTFQYMYNINDHVNGHAGINVDLPNVSMRHGYFQYGIGATKTWKDRLNSYVQFVIRNGGRTGVGFQLGFQYMFDWNEIFKFKKNPSRKK